MKSGGSQYPIPMLQKLGIDMTNKKPFELAMAKMNELLDEMERLFDE